MTDLPRPYYDSGDGRAVLYHGDALDVLRQMEPLSIGAVVTDPPYLSVSTGASRVSRVNAIPDESQFFEFWMAEVWRSFARVLRMDGSLWMTIDWRGALAAERVSGPSPLTFAALGVWDKDAIGMGHVLRHSYECFVVAKMPEWQRRDAAASDVWRFKWGNGARKHNHEAEKPVDLMQRAVRLFAPEAGVVLDPFLGSGTTGIAALTEGRPFVGVERDEAYCETAARRLDAALAQTSLAL